MNRVTQLTLTAVGIVRISCIGAGGQMLARESVGKVTASATLHYDAMIKRP
jgi:hypothetical protein